MILHLPIMPSAVKLVGRRPSTVIDRADTFLSHPQSATNSKPLGQPHKSVRAALCSFPATGDGVLLPDAC